MKKISLTEKIEQFKKIHGDKYDYSLVDYINSKTKIKIICPKHGIFEQLPENHLNGQGCLKCINEKQTKTTESFINGSKIIHGDKYDYSLVDYINNKTKVKIICPKHGIFEQKPSNHLRGSKCPKCSYEHRKTSVREIINKCNKKFNYKFIYDIENYSSINEKVKIICPKHGEFYLTLNGHYNSINGCPYCASKKMNTELFKTKSNKIHNHKYDYSLVNYIDSYEKVKIICPKHGIFEQVSYIHLNGSGCPKCKTSKGEEKIINYLDNNNIKYEYQKIFENCKSKTYLPFDFYLPDKNITIEYDGEQHFRPIEYFGGNKKFLERKEKDKIKTNFCFCNKIKLIRISYLDDIEKILNDNLINYE